MQGALSEEHFLPQWLMLRRFGTLQCIERRDDLALRFELLSGVSAAHSPVLVRLIHHEVPGEVLAGAGQTVTGIRTTCDGIGVRIVRPVILPPAEITDLVPGTAIEPRIPATRAG